MSQTEHPQNLILGHSYPGFKISNPFNYRVDVDPGKFQRDLLHDFLLQLKSWKGEHYWRMHFELCKYDRHSTGIKNEEIMVKVLEERDAITKYEKTEYEIVIGSDYKKVEFCVTEVPLLHKEKENFNHFKFFGYSSYDKDRIG